MSKDTKFYATWTYRLIITTFLLRTLEEILDGKFFTWDYVPYSLASRLVEIPQTLCNLAWLVFAILTLISLVKDYSKKNIGEKNGS